MRKGKQYYAALLGLLGIAVVGTGISFGVTAQKRQEKPKSTAVSEEPSQVVLKNQTPKTAFVVPEKVEEPKAEAKPAFSEETDTAQAGIFHREALFEMPVVGEIVMDYSMEHGIYDVTLNQYRTNDCLSIDAEVGEPVCAAEDGVVETIFMDEERGKTLVINHQNGWKTTYSQLDELDVEKGDNVKKGETLGNVSEPTKYGVALGPHLDFAMSKDGEKVDPKSVLTE